MKKAINLYSKFDKFDEYLILDFFKLLNSVSKLFSLILLVFKSEDFDGCIKLINKREVNSTFFDIAAIKVNKLN